MAGRPSAPICIVDGGELLDVLAIQQEKWSFHELCPKISTAELARKWLAKRRLIKNTCTCQQCYQPASLTGRKDISDGGAKISTLHVEFEMVPFSKTVSFLFRNL
jgi:hypothetical protein